MYRKTSHISEATAGGPAKLGAPGGPLEVRALFLQVLVVRLDGHKLQKAGGIHLNLFCLN